MNSSARNPSMTGYIYAVTAAFGAGLAYVIGKWNLQEISALLLSCCIFTVATIALTVFWLPFRGLQRTFVHSLTSWFWVAMFSVTSWLAIWFMWAGVARMDPSLASFLTRAEVPFVIFLGVLLLKEKFSRLEIWGGLLSIAGIVIMRLTLRFEYSSGFWFVLAGAFFFGLTEFVSKIAIRYIEPITLAYLRNLLMAGAYWAVFAGSGQSLDGLDKVWPGVIALGLIGPILSRMMYLLALKHMDLSKAAIISQTQPVFVMILAALAWHQLPTLRETTGGVCLVIGCILMILARHWADRPTPLETPKGT